MKGTFITFEGSEGSGKSTQARALFLYLKKKKKPVLHIREPGGVKISEDIRRILLDVRNKRMGKICETLLYMAARAQLVEEVIAPALKSGRIVLCDRFLDSTLCYQGYGAGVNLSFIREVGRIATNKITPDLTFVFDLPVKKGLSRTGKVKDRIELRSLDYHNRVRRGYLTLAKNDPGRVKVIDAGGTKEKIQGMIRNYIDRIIR